MKLRSRLRWKDDLSSRDWAKLSQVGLRKMMTEHLRASCRNQKRWTRDFIDARWVGDEQVRSSDRS